MPHIIIEYSENVAAQHNIQALVDHLHAAALDHGLPTLDSLRTRAVAREHYRIADGDPHHAFVAITARIGPGRSAEVKMGFLETLIDRAEQTMERDRSTLAIAFSAEIQEIDPDFRINRNHVRERMLAPPLD